MLELNYKEFGAGDPVVILHGLFGSLDNWQSMAKELGEKYLVYIVDQRNHGKSPHTEAFNYKLLAEDLHNFLRSKGIFRTNLVGHSMGGKTAMQFAAMYPEFIDKLVVVDIGPFQNPGGHEEIFEALMGVDLDKVSSRNEVSDLLKPKFEDASVLLFLLKNLSRTKEGGYQWKMNLDSLHKHYSDILEEIPGEQLFFGDTLFIRGGKSNYLPEDGEESLKKWFPEAKLVSIPDAGHWVHAEAPEAFFKILDQFLSH